MFLRRLTSTANRSIINTNVCSLAFREGVMDYKKMIIKMVEKIESEEALEIIHDFVIVPYNRENYKKSKREEREN